MSERSRFSQVRPSLEPRQLTKPGDFVRDLGRRLDWHISTHNIMVEGSTDVDYFQLAARLYQKEKKLSLLDESLSIFAVGARNRGGTKAMQRYLPVLHDLLPTDPVDYNGKEFGFLVLLDCDAAGKGAARSLTGENMGLRMNRDVFLLQRVLPRDTRDPGQFQKKSEQLNSDWATLDCEIEDLVNGPLLEEFVRENHGCCKRGPILKNGAHHYDWHGHLKPSLFRFVESNALMSDVSLIVEVLQSLRYMLRLHPEGD